MLLVSEANIFIDFEVAELIQQLFKLPHEINVPDTLYEQELRSRHAHLLGLGLMVRTLSADEVSFAYEMRLKYARPGVNDLFALVLAKSLACPLVTGDRDLRAAAEAEGLELLGTLTLIEQMFNGSLVSLDEVELAYGRMKKFGRRLPWRIVEEQLERMRRG
jgi:predicted nucleic acid-binding protein